MQPEHDVRQIMLDTGDPDFMVSNLFSLILVTEERVLVVVLCRLKIDPLEEGDDYLLN